MNALKIFFILALCVAVIYATEEKTEKDLDSAEGHLGYYGGYGHHGGYYGGGLYGHGLYGGYRGHYGGYRPVGFGYGGYRYGW